MVYPVYVFSVENSLILGVQTCLYYAMEGLNSSYVGTYSVHDKILQTIKKDTYLAN